MLDSSRLAVRWTVGDVSEAGFEALGLSLWGAWGLFGPKACYGVVVNTIGVAEARRRTGPVPKGVRWVDATGQVPEFVRPYLDPAMAEGVGWKFAPLRLFPEHFELSLDNDCILWDWPASLRAWLAPSGPARCLFAEDVARGLGQFSHLCGPAPRNSGIRGLPPGFDYQRALKAVLAECPVLMRSELDEQGLQTAAVERHGNPLLVRVDEVSICSPFPPHRAELGRCGAHFVGLNSHGLPWSHLGRPASDWTREHWQRHQPEICRRVGVATV